MRTQTPEARVQNAIRFLSRLMTTPAREATVRETLTAWANENTAYAESLRWPDLLSTLVDVGDEAGVFNPAIRRSLDRRVAVARAVPAVGRAPFVPKVLPT